MITCYFDGSCEPQNPGGNMGIGAIVLKKQEVLFQHSSSIDSHPCNTNNVAEYLALIKILDFLHEVQMHENRIGVYGDSMLVVNQMKGLWRMKQGLYLQYAKEAKSKLGKFTNLSINWIPREKNSIADDLSKTNLF